VASLLLLSPRSLAYFRGGSFRELPDELGCECKAVSYYMIVLCNMSQWSDTQPHG